MSSPIVISQYDKPFILLLIITMALLAIIIYGSISGKWMDIEKAVTTLVPFVSIGYGFYFKSKM